MHDAIVGERMGVPSVGIMTSKFVGAAELMARALGAEGHRIVAIDHPISSATLEDLDARARKAAAECADILCRAGPGSERKS